MNKLLSRVSTSVIPMFSLYFSEIVGKITSPLNVENFGIFSVFESQNESGII